MSIITVIVLLNICFFYFHIEQQAKIKTPLSSDKRKHLTLIQKFRHRINDKSIEINSLELLHNFDFFLLTITSFLGGWGWVGDLYLCNWKKKYQSVYILSAVFGWLRICVISLSYNSSSRDRKSISVDSLSILLNSGYKWKVIFLNLNRK